MGNETKIQADAMYEAFIAYTYDQSTSKEGRVMARINTLARSHFKMLEMLNEKGILSKNEVDQITKFSYKS